MHPDDPRRKMPIMYRRQKEIEDGSVYYYSSRSKEVIENVQKSKKQLQMRKMQKRGRLLLFGNLILLAVVIGVFSYLHFNTNANQGMQLQVSARWLEPQVIATIRIVAGAKAAEFRGSLVRVWVWVRKADLTYFEGQPVPPEAILFMDVVPIVEGEELVFRERFALGGIKQLEKYRIQALLEYDDGQILADTIISKE